MVLFERFRGFNCYPFKKIDLNFRNQGLVRMAGPNGSGKSSAFHLFTQCCQGTSPNAAKKSDIIIGDKDFLLEVTFEKNGSRYVAAHAVKSKEKSPTGEAYGTGVYLFRDGQDISKHKDPDTVKLIRATLGWTLSEWYGYVYLQQQTTHTLINGTRSERQDYLSALFNLQPLDHLASYFKLKAEDLKVQVEQNDRNKQELSIKQQMYRQDDFSRIKAEHQEAIDVIKILDGKIEVAEKAQRRYEFRLSLEKKLSELTCDSESIETLQNQLDTLEKQQVEVLSNRILRSKLEAALHDLIPVQEPLWPEGWREEYEDSPDLDEKRERAELNQLIQLESTLIEVPSVQIPQDFIEVLSSPDINLSQIHRQVAEIESRPVPPTFPKPTREQLTAAHDEFSSISYKILQIKEDIKKLSVSGDVCDKCGSDLKCEDRNVKLSKKLEEIEELEDQKLVASNRLKAREKQAEAWACHEALGPDRSNELPELKASIELFKRKQEYLKLQQGKIAHEEYLTNLNAIQKLPELKERLRIWELKKAAKKVQDAKQKRTQYLREKERLESELKTIPSLSDQAQTITDIKKRIQASITYQQVVLEFEPYKDATDRTATIERFKTERDEQQTQAGSLQATLSQYQMLMSQIAVLQESIAKQESTIRDQKRYALLAKAYGKAGGLRERQLSKFSRFLEEALLSHTIKQLPEHRFQFNVDDGIDILAEYVGVEKPKTDPYDIKYMSGGEKGALSVAFLFALDDLLPPNRRTNVKILDEAEGNLDAKRQEDFINATLPELRKRAETVIVISHTHAANAGGFDRIWEVGKGEIVERVMGREFA